MTPSGKRIPHLIEQVLSCIPDTLFILINTAGVVTYCNPATALWLHGSQKQLLGQPVERLKHPLFRVFQAADWREKAQSPDSDMSFDIVLDGQSKSIRVCLTPLQDIRGDNQGYLFQARRLSAGDACLLELRLQRLQALAKIGSWELNLKTGQALWSDQTRRLLGVADGAPACPETLLSQVHPDDRIGVASALREAIESRRLYDLEYRVLHRDAQVRVLRSRADTAYDETDDALKLIGFVQDITDLREAEDKIRLSASVFDASLNSILIMDTRSIIQQVNRSFTQSTGYFPAEVIGQSIGILQSQQNDEALYEHIWQVIETGGLWKGEMWCRRKNGEAFPVWLSMTAVRDAKGETNHYIGTFNDITEQKISADYIYQLAHYDLLTGLPNRVLFSERCRHAIERSRRNRHNTLLLYLDLDRFKQINDSLGHPVGDELLERVAERLKLQVREEDTVARLGGDEFVLVVEQVSDERDAERVASKILESLREPFQLKNHELVISASIGISISPMDGDDVATLIKHADLAMYRAKDRGRDNYQFFSLELSKDTLEYHLLESDLRHALRRGELLVFYQPQYDLKSGALVGAEALVRWQHQEQGLLLPNRFIPVAEESGLILDIGAWVLTAACRQMKQWRDAGIDLQRISVNLSGLQIKRGNLEALIGQVLAETGLPPSCLELEILETYIMRQVEQDVHVLENLRNLGVHLAIDDFGTGRSSLAYLKRLPVEKLKIDRSFVMDIPDDGDDNAITRAIVALGKSMQLKVVAEGVENDRQAAFLQEIGCDQVQGFYYSPPLDAVHFEEILRSHRSLNQLA